MENAMTGLTWQNSYSKSDNHSVQLWLADKLLIMHNMLNLEADVLQQQETTSCFISVSQEQKAEAAVMNNGVNLWT